MTVHLPDVFPEITTVELTCWACPMQYVGTLVDGRHFYFRYRHGGASLGLGATADAAIGDPEAAHLDYPKVADGILDNDELVHVLGHLLLARGIGQPTSPTVHVVVSLASDLATQPGVITGQPVRMLPIPDLPPEDYNQVLFAAAVPRALLDDSYLGPTRSPTCSPSRSGWHFARHSPTAQSCGVPGDAAVVGPTPRPRRRLLLEAVPAVRTPVRPAEDFLDDMPPMVRVTGQLDGAPFTTDLPTHLVDGPMPWLGLLLSLDTQTEFERRVLGDLDNWKPTGILYQPPSATANLCGKERSVPR